MSRSHVALFLLLGVPVALYAAVIVPRNIPARTDEPTTPAAYFPTTVGTKWVYQVTQYRHGKVLLHGETSEMITEAGAERFVTARQVSVDRRFDRSEWVISETGVRTRTLPQLDREGRDRWERKAPGPLFLILPSDITPGQSWITDTPNERCEVHTVTGWETIRVPVGTYHALRLNYEQTSRATGNITGTMWYAPGVGRVKMELVLRDPTLRAIIELKSFHSPTDR
jgi:hypothetical protein